MTLEQTLVPFDKDQAKQFCGLCLASGYTQSWVDQRLGLLVPPPANRVSIELAASLDQEPRPVNLLGKLFFLGMPIDRTIAELLLPSEFLDACIASGLVVHDGATFRPTCLVVPVGESFLASDLQRQEYQDDDRFVPPLCDAAMHLNAVAVRKNVNRTLDLCSGFALHGILSAANSGTVVVSDLNPRAESFAQFNAALNSCDNLTAVTGDLFGAVKGERFDLILANPPFIISPDAVTTFRYSPFELDGFVRRMLTEAPDYLEEGGLMQTIVEWVEIEGQKWEKRLAQWVANNGCDVWILPANRQLPSNYARSVLSQTIADEFELQKQQKHWEQYFRDQKVEAIQGGFIFMRRRRATKNWFDITQLTKPIRRPIGHAIAQGISNRDLVFSEQGDEPLLASRPRVVNGVRQVETSLWKEFRFRRDSIVLHLDDGLPVTIGIDEYVRNLIEKFDGNRTVQAGLDLFSKEVGLPEATGREQGILFVRSMLRNGVLSVPA